MKKHRIQQKFLDELKQIPIVRIACGRSGISHNSVYRWRAEDPRFASLMDEALAEGEDFVNDLTESKLLTLIKEKQFAAIRFWLTHRHPIYKKRIEAVTTETNNDAEEERIIKELGLTEEDFTDEKRDITVRRIADYLNSR